jgi:outer membrane protein assembly factor BamA
MRVVFIFIFFCTGSLFLTAQVDSSRTYVIGQSFFTGNEKTKEFVLDRELTYQIGDTISLSKLNQKVLRTEENLFNTSLFNKVSSNISITDSGTVNIDYELEERWYVWPYPILENGDRNFNTWWQTKDFSRLTYGVFLNWFNFRGRNETLLFMFKVGFENQFSIGYRIPNLNKKKTWGIYMAAGYSEYREVNYTSVGNKRIFYKSLDGPGRQVVFGRMDLTYRRSLNSRHTIGLNYNQIRVDSNVQDLSTDYLKGNKAQTDFFTLRYYGKYDTRDYIEYPLKGYKVELYVYKYGLGLLQNEGLNLLTTTLGVYWHKPIKGRWYFANSVVGKMSFFDDPPYSLQQGLGYKNAIRGYELYVMDAQNYGVVKTNLKFALIKKKEFSLNWFPIDKFSKPYFSMYLNAYFDFGYADDTLYAQENLLSNKWAYGYGLGLDITGFYDFIMRLEYSFNREKESGFFLHFKKAI